MTAHRSPPGEVGGGRPLLALALAIVTVVAVVFCDSAFRIDDPLFLWSAERIVHHPLDPFGFEVNWYGVPESMAATNQNPPLVAYYQAAVFVLFGTSERALHLAFLLPAILCLVAVYHLGRRLGSCGGSAALLAAASPVFLVSSLTVMTDMWLTAFWSLACWCWVRGVQREEWPSLLLGAGFSGLAASTKYFGLACPLLLAAYAIAKRRGRLACLWWLALPAAMVLAWSIASASLYGASHPLQAFSYAGHEATWERLGGTAVTALSFLGGCTLFPAALLLQPPRRRPALVASAVFVALVAAGLVGRHLGGFGRTLDLREALSLALFGLLGAALLRQTAAAWRADRSAERLLLALWIYGTCAFVAALNWTVAGRSFLPLVPAAAMVVASAVDRTAAGRSSAALRLAAVVAFSSLCAVAATRADAALADSARQAAEELARQYGNAAGRVRFTGHWGFQYYMQRRGGVPFDPSHPAWGRDDVLVVPVNNSNAMLPDPRSSVVLVEALRYRPSRYLATMSSGVAAGFYSSLWGPLPFSVGRVPAEEYLVFGDTAVWRGSTGAPD